MLPPPPEILDPPVAEGEGFRLVSNMDEEIPGPEGGAFAALMNTPPAEPIRGATAMPMSDLVTVHFAFDSAQLDQVAMDALSNNLSWLLAHPGVQIQIEGHCDERGTVEYNLLLGERRAQAVRAYLVGQGVPADSLHTISYGEERPLDPTPTETAFSMNRRAQFLVY
jgi:peptidoglycan-associated lipoprotein